MGISEILAEAVGCFTNDFKIPHYCVNCLFICEESLKIKFIGIALNPLR
jgi:hypothetical protein